MNIESQVCSLELAKRLRELGVKQDSLFCWTTDYDLEFLPTEIRNNNVCISAFTVAELGEMLPSWCQTKIIEDNKYYEIGTLTLINKCEYDWDCLVGDENEANVRAKMLIYLLENGLIKNEEL